MGNAGWDIAASKPLGKIEDAKEVVTEKTIDDSFERLEASIMDLKARYDRLDRAWRLVNEFLVNDEPRTINSFQEVLEKARAIVQGE